MNTKKQRMTVVAVLGLVAVSVGFLIPSRGLAADAKAPPSKPSTTDLATKLIGTWKLESAVTPGSPSGIGTRLKLITATHWCIIQPDPATGVIVFQHGGRYVLEGNQMKESVEFAGELTKSSIGKTGTRIIEVEGDTYKQVDPNGVFTETWKRVK
jgi:hypothetical protein